MQKHLSMIDFDMYNEDADFTDRMAACPWNGSTNLLEKVYKILATADVMVVSSLVGIQEPPINE